VPIALDDLRRALGGILSTLGEAVKTHHGRPPPASLGGPA
jgi:hypothetical protein